MRRCSPAGRLYQRGAVFHSPKWNQSEPQIDATAHRNRRLEPTIIGLLEAKMCVISWPFTLSIVYSSLAVQLRPSQLCQRVGPRFHISWPQPTLIRQRIQRRTHSSSEPAVYLTSHLSQTRQPGQPAQSSTPANCELELPSGFCLVGRGLTRPQSCLLPSSSLPTSILKQTVRNGKVIGIPVRDPRHFRCDVKVAIDRER